MRRAALAGIVLAAVCWTAAAVRAGSYGTELPFAAGVGARTSGLGLAGASLLERPSLQYVNPGFLGRVERQAFEFYRTTLFSSDAQYHAVSYVRPSLDYGTIGVSVLRLDVGGIEERDDINNLLGEIKNSQTRILLGYGFELQPALSAGLNLKIDNQSFGGFRGTGVGLDVGLHGFARFSDTSFLRSFSAGLAIENLVEPKIKLDQDDAADPMRLLAGVSVRGRHGPFAFVTALDLANPRFSPVLLRVGQEIDYDGVVAVRVGADGSTPTFGLGGTYRGVSLDYAYRSVDLGSNHRFSLTVALGRSIGEREAEREARLDAQLSQRVAQKMGEFERRQLDVLLARADSLYDAGTVEEAMDQYDMVLLWDPMNVRAAKRYDQCRYEVEVARGRQLFEEGDYVAALYRLRQAAQTNSSDPSVGGLIAECQRRISEAQDRSRLVDRLLKDAIDLYAEGRYGEALTGFQEILRVEPGNRLAREYEYKSQTNISNAVQRQVLRSRAHADRGRYGAAIDALEKALALAPQDEDIRSEIELLRQRQKQQQRTDERQTSVAREPTTARGLERASGQTRVDTRVLDAKFERGVKFFEQGQFEDAARELMAVWTVAPAHRDVARPLTRAYLFLGMKVYSEERFEDAIRIWEKILAIDPGNDKAQRYLQKTREEARRLTGGRP